MPDPSAADSDAPASPLDTPQTLGRKATDRVTGFTGTATARATYLTGCDQIKIEPLVDDTGNCRSAEWFDIDRVEFSAGGVASVVGFR